MADLLHAAVGYREYFATPDEHPAGDWGFLCIVCSRDVTETPCPDHAPRDVPGLRLVDCWAETKHLVWVHDREDYGVSCPFCRLAEYWGKEERERQCRHWGWRRWRATHWFTGKLYVLGVTASGGGWSIGDGHNGCMPTGSLRWRGQRVYILGVRREVWRCWRRGHRRGEEVGFGFCGKCVPWPCCGAQTEAHATGCAEAVPA